MQRLGRGTREPSAFSAGKVLVKNPSAPGTAYATHPKMYGSSPSKSSHWQLWESSTRSYHMRP